MPWIVVVGKKLAEGLVEVKNRKTGERLDVEVSKIVSHLKSII
jgi:prolyl-tRNA synthetase